MRTKEQVKEWVIENCRKYGVRQPNNWYREEVQKAVDEIRLKRNTHCPFCGVYNGTGFSEVVCTCEVAPKYDAKYEEWRNKL